MLALAKGDDCIVPTPTFRFTLGKYFPLLLSVAFLFISSASFAQVPCSNTTLGCYGQINLAIDGECHAVIDVNALISNYNPADSYTVTFTAEDGTIYIGNDIGQFLGQTLTFAVADDCGNNCWGYISVEDKTGAILNDCDDVTLTCEEFELGNSEVLYRPTFHPDCDITAPIFTFEDDTLNVMCQNGFANSILRTWDVYTYNGDFIAQCEQTINIEILDLASVVFPSDTIITSVLNCDAFTDAGMHPDSLGYPTGILCPNFNWYYTDIEFEIPCINRKILRKWTVIDWCSGDLVKGEHIIKVLDVDPPHKVCPPDTIKFPSYYGCISQINLDPLDKAHGTGAVTDLIECSETEVFVEFIPAEPGTNQPEEGGTYSSLGVIAEANGTYTLPMISEGLAWVRYRFEDACGNVSPLSGSGTGSYNSCYFEVQVVDGVPPTAICEGYTNVNLDHYGYATLNAYDIDDHSNDDCGDIDRYEIKREGYCVGHENDQEFGPTVHFCCSDVGQNIWVTLRVYDEMGNYSECKSQVIVNAGTYGGGGLTIHCPADITLDCTDDYHYYNFPDVTVGSHGDCSDDPGHYYTDVSFDSSNITGCGTGYITRTVLLTFDDGSTSSCSHRIYIDAADPIDPADISVQDEILLPHCSTNGGSLNPDVIGGKPVIHNSVPCQSVTIEHTDKILAGTYDHCQIIERTWVITDFCALYGPQEYTYIQLIKLSDIIPPTFTSCTNAMYSTTDGDCDVSVLYSVSVKDNCTPDPLIDITWTLDVFSDGIGTNDLSGNGASILQVLPLGDHAVTFTAVDACGNDRSCTSVIMVKGGTNSGPTPVCLTEVEWTLNPYGEAEIWASDFNFASHGGCNGTGSDLLYSFSNPAFEITPVANFTCDNIPNGISTQIPVQIWVFDGSGNSSSCTSILTLTDILDVCPDQGGGPVIYGRLSSEDGTPVSDMEVMLENMTEDEMNYQMSEDDGAYAFENMNFFSDYMVKPENDENHLLGVSTLDIVKIQKHILKIKELDSPYKLIAADVNKSGSITAIDLIHIRKLILGQYNKFPNSKSWTFVKEGQVFADEENPWGYEDQTYIQNLSNEASENNFTAIKVGDVNGSATSTLQGENTELRNQAFILNADDLGFKAGDELLIPIYSKQFDEVYGLQFTMESKSLDLLSIKNAKLQVNESNYVVKDGILTFTWNDISGITIDESILFYVVASAKVDGTISNNLSITSKVTKSEVYTGESLTTSEIYLQVGSNEVFETALGQNRPNPFSENSEIEFTLGKAQDASITFYDPQGKELKKISDHFPKGRSTVTVSSEWFGSTGIVYYKLEAGQYAAIRKMVIVN